MACSPAFSEPPCANSAPVDSDDHCRRKKSTPSEAGSWVAGTGRKSWSLYRGRRVDERKVRLRFGQLQGEQFRLRAAYDAQASLVLDYTRGDLRGNRQLIRRSGPLFAVTLSLSLRFWPSSAIEKRQIR